MTIGRKGKHHRLTGVVFPGRIAGMTKVPVLGVLGAASTTMCVLFVGLPVAALCIRAVREERLLTSLTSESAMTALRLSLVTSIAAMVVILVVGTPFAYVLARGKSSLLRVLDGLVELPLVLPPVVAGIAMLMAFGRGGILGPALEATGISIVSTSIAVVFAQLFVAAPFYIRSAKLGFQSVLLDYVEISQTLGVSPWRTFFRLTLPLAGPSIITGIALAWARALSEFGATMMFAGNMAGRTQTMPLAIMTAMETDLAIALALSALLLVVSVAILSGLSIASRRNWQSRS